MGELVIRVAFLNEVLRSFSPFFDFGKNSNESVGREIFRLHINIQIPQISCLNPKIGEKKGEAEKHLKLEQPRKSGKWAFLRFSTRSYFKLPKTSTYSLSIYCSICRIWPWLGSFHPFSEFPCQGEKLPCGIYYPAEFSWRLIVITYHTFITIFQKSKKRTEPS